MGQIQSLKKNDEQKHFAIMAAKLQQKQTNINNQKYNNTRAENMKIVDEIMKLVKTDWDNHVGGECEICKSLFPNSDICLYNEKYFMSFNQSYGCLYGEMKYEGLDITILKEIFQERGFEFLDHGYNYSLILSDKLVWSLKSK